MPACLRSSRMRSSERFWKDAVAGGQRLVDQQHVVVLGGGDGEAQPGAHAGGVRPHRQGDEVALLVDAGEVDDVLVALLDLLAGHAHGQAAEVGRCARRSGRSSGRRSRRGGRAGRGCRSGRSRRGQQPRDRLEQRRLARSRWCRSGRWPRPCTRRSDTFLTACTLRTPAAVSACPRRSDAVEGGGGAAASGAGAVDPVDDVDVVDDDGGDASVRAVSSVTRGVSATAVRLLGLPEVDESADAGEQRPARRDGPHVRAAAGSAWKLSIRAKRIRSM